MTQQHLELRPATPPPAEINAASTDLVSTETRLVTLGVGAFTVIAENGAAVPVITGKQGAINPEGGPVPTQPRTEHLSGEIVDSNGGGQSVDPADTAEFNRDRYLPTTNLAPWAWRDTQPKQTAIPGNRIGDKPPHDWLDPTKDDPTRIFASWPERVRQRLEVMRRRGILPPALDSGYDAQLARLYHDADNALEETRKVVTEALTPVDEHGDLPLARAASRVITGENPIVKPAPAQPASEQTAQDASGAAPEAKPNWVAPTTASPVRKSLRAPAATIMAASAALRRLRQRTAAQATQAEAAVKPEAASPAEKVTPVIGHDATANAVALEAPQVEAAQAAEVTVQPVALPSVEGLSLDGDKIIIDGQEITSELLEYINLSTAVGELHVKLATYRAMPPANEDDRRKLLSGFIWEVNNIRSELGKIAENPDAVKKKDLAPESAVELIPLKPGEEPTLGGVPLSMADESQTTDLAARLLAGLRKI